MNQNLTSPVHATARRGWVKTLVAVTGAVALVGALGTGAIAGVQMLNRGGGVHSASVEGVSELSVHVAGGEFDLVYADVAEATLVVEGDARWTLRNNAGTLEVRAPWRLFGGWFGLSDRVVLTLPASVRDAGWDADFRVSAGEARVTGDFDDLQLRVSAGSLTATATSADIDASVSAGSMNVAVTDAATARFHVSAGRIDAVMNGEVPGAVDVSVSAGDVNLTVPDAVYNVSSDVSAGGFDHDLETASSSAHEIDVRVSAGSVRIRPAQ